MKDFRKFAVAASVLAAMGMFFSSGCAAAQGDGDDEKPAAAQQEGEDKDGDED